MVKMAFHAVAARAAFGMMTLTAKCRDRQVYITGFGALRRLGMAGHALDLTMAVVADDAVPEPA